MEIIRARNLTVRKGKTNIFKNLSFAIEEGEHIRLVGESGTGKTTLFKILLGFDVPDEGEIQVFGKDVSRDHILDIRQKIGYVSQETEVGEGKVINLLDEIKSFRFNKITNFKERTDYYLEKFRLEKFTLQKDYKDLSGGEKQRVMAIITLLLDRPVLLLDEPVTGMDQKLKNIVLGEFFSMKEKTILIISHEDDVLSNYNLREISIK